ncbi:MAG: sigma-54 dependent transcriptional regulator [Phycisphaerae bacterium]|nr:sigma-54 dependent transcriptional regulator [Phycisphaerae bacterium]
MATTGKPVPSLPRIVGTASAIRRLAGQIEMVSRRNCTVLTLGESGTGKELVARHIHAASSRAAGPFVVVDCTTMHDTLLESQLFGHVKGAFTGATHSTLGLFRAADHGTLFLDEVGELPPAIQAKLLRCIQESVVTPLGSTGAVPVDVRIIAATHRDLEDMVRKGTFRTDLYYRLNVVRLQVPPLRQRRGDIPALANHFLAEQARIYDEPAKQLSPAVLDIFSRHAWPGNVRELQNAVENACVFCPGSLILPEHLPESLRQETVAEVTCAFGRIRSGVPESCVPTTLALAERNTIRQALSAASGNRTRAAELLGVERHRLARLIQRHKLIATAVAYLYTDCCWSSDCLLNLFG